MGDLNGMTPQQLIATMDDVQKLEFLAEIIGTMNPAFKQTVINELAKNQSAGEATISINGDGQTVRIDFDRALAWFRIPNANAVELAMQMLQAAGAQLDKVIDMKSQPE